MENNSASNPPFAIPNYFMGVDPYGYDNVKGAVCVIRKDGIVEYLKNMNCEEIDKEVKRLAVLYNIPDKWIFKEEK